jgi:limonene-1,2-epoxide hydrolase
LLLAASSSVLAAERYTEVWNPPEAQTVKGKAKTRGVMPVQAKKKHKNNVTSVKKVADGTAVAQSPAQAVAPRVKPAPKQVDPLMNLPRKIGPDGQVMRV